MPKTGQAHATHEWLAGVIFDYFPEISQSSCTESDWSDTSETQVDHVQWIRANDLNKEEICHWSQEKGNPWETLSNKSYYLPVSWKFCYFLLKETITK